MKKTVKKPPVAEEEKFLDENDTKEIQDYIRELGLDGVQPSAFERSETKEKRKASKKLDNGSKATISHQNSVPLSQPDKQLYKDKQKPVKKTEKPIRNNAILPPKPFSPVTTQHVEKQHQNQQQPIEKPHFNKNTMKIETPIIIPPLGSVQKAANKKIVFDEEYLLNSSNTSKPGKDSSNSKDVWYNLLIKPDVAWHQQDKATKASLENPPAELVKQCEEEGKRYLEEDTLNYEKVRAIGTDKSENRWIQTVLKSGTFSDKIAAHTLLLQESPPHNLSSLKFLISLLNVKGRRECLASLESLLRILTEGRILNPKRKLSLMSKKPLSTLSNVSPRERKELLALWYFEHQLKDYYNQILIALDEMLKDSVDTTRRKGIAALTSLLSYSPEQEQAILSRIVNKIGDPTRAVATSTVGQLEKLLQKHSQMKSVVVAEVERLLYRANINTKAQYYALCFLSQILLDHEDILLATKLIIIYVSFFKACVKKGDVDSKLMSALLTGLKRAYPYTKSTGEGGGPLDGHVDTLFKLVHMVRFSLGIQVLCILDQIVEIDKTNSDRFYSVLFRKLFDADIGLSTKQTMFLNLLYRVLKRDYSIPRQQMFVKRILQVCLGCPPQLACGFLYLVSELIQYRPALKSFKEEVKAKVFAEDDDDDENYKDVEDQDDDVEKDATGKVAAERDAVEGPEEEETSTEMKKPTWIHRNNSHIKVNLKTEYDSLARNPLFGRPENSGGLWELKLLTNHYHPSVALFANTIVEGAPIKYTGDPLQDFTLSRFLDRFVFRNPKQVSAAQVKKPAQRRILGKRSIYAPLGVRGMAVDSKAFLKQPKRNIPADEMFLYQYFKQRTVKGPRLEKNSDDDNSDLESVASDEFEQYLAENTDFASEIKPKSKTEKKQKKKKDTEEGVEEEEEENDLEDLEEAEMDSEEDFDNDDEFQDAFKDFDDMLNEEPGDVDENLEGKQDDESDEEGFREEDVEFSNDEDEVNPLPPSKGKSKKRGADDIDDLDWALDAKPSSSKKKRNRDLFAPGGVDFVAAEDFAAMLESNATGLKNAGTSEAFANKDKASVKQLQWEMSRDRWMKDLNRPKKGAKKQGNKKKKSISGPAFRKSRAKPSRK